MPTINETQCIEELINIIENESIDDAHKAEMVRSALVPAKQNIHSLRNIIQNFGDINSPVRLSILKSLPRTFGVLHKMGGEMLQFDRRNRTANHSFLDLVNLMEQTPAFSSNDAGNFGYGGVIYTHNKETYSWLYYYEGEIDIEIGAERGHAKANMASKGIMVPIEEEKSLIFSRRPSGTLECWKNEVPKGNTLQEYVTNPRSGYRRPKPSVTG